MKNQNGVKFEYYSIFCGLMQYLENDGLRIKKCDRVKEISRSDMQEMANESKGTNRIYKPIPLLFWIDCKNGKFSNWNR